MSKKNLILTIVFLVLFGAAYVYQGPFKDRQVSSKKPENFLASLEVEKLDKIEISGEDPISLERSDRGWKIGGTKDFYASASVMDDAIARLKSLAECDLEIVSRKKENRQDFMTGENGTRIVLYSGGNKTAEFVSGKMTNDYSGNYVFAPDGEETYGAPVNLSIFSDAGGFYDKTVFSSDAGAINKIRFQYPRREFTVEKKDGKWQGTKPLAFPVDESKIEEIAALMSGLQAAIIPEQKFEGTGLEKNLIIVQATGDGIDNTVMVGEESQDEKGMFYAKKGDSDNIYLISGEDREKLDKKYQDLK